MSKLLIIFSSFFVLYSCAKENDLPIVTTGAGEVEGHWFENVAAFQGIPYAQSPTGQLRFQKPVPLTKWNGRLQAKKFATSCPQFGSSYATNEDCLYLNVFVPRNVNTSLLPVLVWLSSTYDSGSASDYTVISLKKLIDHGMVIVTVNFRLNFFGFFHVADQSSKFPANLAMWDQVLALQWVKREIRSFGGDPNRVTLSGHGYGSAMASLHTYSSASSGLFSKIILHSGTAMNPFAVSGNRYKIESSEWMISALEYFCDNATSTEDAIDLALCLKNKTWSDIQRGMTTTAQGNRNNSLFLNLDHDSMFQSPWCPNLDGKDGFLSDLPSATPDHPRTNISVLVGSVKNEKAILGMRVENESDYEWILGFLARGEAFPGKFKIVHSLLKFFYANQYDVEKDREFWKNVTVQTASDYWIHVGVAQEAMKLHAAGANVFLYSFDYDSGTLSGHEKDLAYLFPGNRKSNKKLVDKVDQQISTQMIKMWANFIKYKDPNQSGSSILWKNLSQDPDGYLSIDTSMTMKKGFHHKAVRLWKEIIEPLVALPYANFERSTNFSEPSDRDVSSSNKLSFSYPMLFWASLGILLVITVTFGLTVKRYQRKIYSYNLMRQRQLMNSS